MTAPTGANSIRAAVKATPPGRHYVPKHPVTATYYQGGRLIAANLPLDAIAVLSTEPVDSPCYGLALTQVALLNLHLSRYPEAIDAAQKALANFQEKDCPMPPMAVMARWIVGDALSRSERVIQSLDHYFAALDLAEDLKKHAPDFIDFLDQEKAVALTHFAGTCNRIEQYPAAEKFASEARGIFQKHRVAARLGMAYALENLAAACTKLKQPDRAGYAIEEALGLPDLSDEQKLRLELSKVQFLPATSDEARPIVQRAIDAAVSEQKWELASLRCGIGLIVSLANSDLKWGDDLVQQALTIEPKLDVRSLAPARLKFYQAELMKRSGADPAETRKVLVVGAHQWCSLTGGRGELPDYQFMAGQMADHFRLLARNCLDAGLNREAFVAFEAGRARAVVAEMRHNLSHPLVADSPFTKAGGITLGLLEKIQAAIPAGEVIVSFASVPPNTACFLVSRDSLEVFEVETPPAIEEELRLIPSRLQEFKGLRSIPDPVQQMAHKLVATIGDRKVRALVPYRTFHLVPWRALLRQCGLKWNQLGFGVSFSPTLMVRHAIDNKACCAIGHGTAGGIDLAEEARAFAAEFKGNGKVVAGAKKADFQAALGTPAVCLVSCHGHVEMGSLVPKVKFALADGRVTLEEAIPPQLRSPLVILSACDSGAYDTLAGDYPAGAAPSVVLRGSSYCMCSRFQIRADFARRFFPAFGRRIVAGVLPEAALAETSAEFDASEDVLWRDLACVEVLIRGD
jgi:tetratricopeptide (TPR) repeat protein